VRVDALAVDRGFTNDSSAWHRPSRNRISGQCGDQPRIVHVDTANRPIDERQAQALAKSAAPGPVRYTEIDAQVDREMAWLDEELELGGL